MKYMARAYCSNDDVGAVLAVVNFTPQLIDTIRRRLANTAKMDRIDPELVSVRYGVEGVKFAAYTEDLICLHDEDGFMLLPEGVEIPESAELPLGACYMEVTAYQVYFQGDAKWAGESYTTEPLESEVLDEIALMVLAAKEGVAA